LRRSRVIWMVSACMGSRFRKTMEAQCEVQGGLGSGRKA
jgi:hypothetical protein